MTRRRAVLLGAALLVVALVVALLTVLPGLLRDDAGPGTAATYPVRASADGTGLVTAGGEPFLYLADTAWLAPSRLDQEGVVELLDARAAQGFTTVQVSALPFLNLDPDGRNAYGAAPLDGSDLAAPLEVGGRTADDTSPDYDYWDHVAFLVEQAGERGLQVTVVPAWYGYEGESWRGYLSPDAAAAFGEFLGERLGGYDNVMWLLGGDDDPVGDTAKVPDGLADGDAVEATDAMAEAIAAAEAVPHLMSYHARRGTSSLAFFADRPWHTFASAYSDERTWEKVADSSGTGVPVVMTEAYYAAREAAPEPDRRRMRAQAWWSVLGGAGYAYGHMAVWDLEPGHFPGDGGSGTWQDALDDPTAADLTVLAEAVGDALPVTPADDLLVSEAGGNLDRVVAGRSGDGATAWVYLPKGGTVEVDLAALGGGPEVVASWLDPSDGTVTTVGPQPADGAASFTAPGPAGGDAVLLLERDGAAADRS